MTELDDQMGKRAAKVREAVGMLCNVYPNTAGKPQVIEAYARQLAVYPYSMLGEVAMALPKSHQSEFCPTIPEILDAMVRFYKTKVLAALPDFIAGVYRTRYIPGDEEHERGFVNKYRSMSELEDMSDESVLQALRNHWRPAEYIERNTQCRIAPREGGPIEPPPKKAKE